MALMKIEDLSASLSIPVDTLRKWVRLRQMPFLKIGRKVRFSQETIDAWLNSKLVLPRKENLLYEPKIQKPHIA